MLQISAVVITQNSEKTLGLTLNSAHNVSKEMIVVDSGSKDRTVELARDFGAKVYHRKFDGYGAQKNHGIKLAKYSWILSMDSDEALSDELIETINNLEDKSRFAGYYFNRLNFYFERPLWHGGQYPDRQLRLFRKNSGKFNDRKIHESVELQGETDVLQGDMLHYSYPTIGSYLRKFDRYTNLEAKRLLASSAELNESKLTKNLLLKPAWKFVWRYFFKGGIMDGVPGLLAASFNSFGIVVSYAKYWEMYRKNQRDEKKRWKNQISFL